MFLQLILPPWQFVDGGDARGSKSEAIGESIDDGGCSQVRGLNAVKPASSASESSVVKTVKDNDVCVSVSYVLCVCVNVSLCVCVCVCCICVVYVLCVVKWNLWT